MMKVVICGAAGQLGMELIDVFNARGDDVLGFDLDLDITVYELTMDKILPLDPDILINSAAYVDADDSELNPDNSYRVNFTGNQNLALVALQAGCPLVYVSSDYVFDGMKGSSYNEFDRVCPTGVYGRAKAASERYTASVLHRYYVFRTQWLFGKYGRRNFVKSIMKNAREKGALRVVTDEVGTPTGARDLAEIIATTATSGKYGIYHATNQGACSRYDFAKEILEAAGMPDVPVEPIKYSDLNLPCPRPPYSPLDNMNLRLQGFPPSRPYREPLNEYIKWLLDSGEL
jgi:dTDP-4-dehydrorhamnose reductase